jgi:hypothetical protein
MKPRKANSMFTNDFVSKLRTKHWHPLGIAKSVSSRSEDRMSDPTKANKKEVRRGNLKEKDWDELVCPFSKDGRHDNFSTLPRACRNTFSLYRLRYV